MSWADMRLIVGGEWKPGANLPFDPMACKLAEKNGISVVVMNGKNFDNLEKYFQGQAFSGTTLS